ncbi:unnamed protein product [marine sediment metagenome]|uniref:Uncharacterized protein n=1 Tax=marine sediment metagenome TaxID=412755 RepID=X1CS49_9ZZZZ
MKEGYLQNKIREQNDRILALENEVKTLLKIVTVSKDNYDQAKELMIKASNVEQYTLSNYSSKNMIIKIIKKEMIKYFFSKP